MVYDYFLVGYNKIYRGINSPPSLRWPLEALLHASKIFKKDKYFCYFPESGEGDLIEASDC